MGLWVICTFFFSFFPHEYGRWRMFQGIFSMQWMEWTWRLVGWVIGVYLPSYFHFRFDFLVIVYLKHVCCYMHNKGLPVLSTYWHIFLHKRLESSSNKSSSPRPSSTWRQPLSWCKTWSTSWQWQRTRRMRTPTPPWVLWERTDFGFDMVNA